MVSSSSETGAGAAFRYFDFGATFLRAVLAARRGYELKRGWAFGDRARQRHELYVAALPTRDRRHLEPADSKAT